jgi:hypothetical protein
VIPPAPAQVQVQAQMTTRGVKRLASAGVNGIGSSGNSSGGLGGEPKKRRRHFLMLETIRKCAKKREQERKLSGECSCHKKGDFFLQENISSKSTETASDPRHPWAVQQDAETDPC